jgi:protease-4
LGLSAAFFVLFLIVTGGVYLYKSPSSSHQGRGAASFLSGGGDIGVVELNGVIMDSKKTLKRLEKFEEDDSIKAVVLRINSPGGAVAPSQEIYEAVKAYKKPLVVSMGSVAASGGYYVAMGAKKVYANPGTITGSIGVIMEFVNLQKLYEWAKVQRYSVKTGKFKDVGAEYREMTAEDRKLLQDMVDDVLKQFKTAVSQGRKLSFDQVTAIADGRIFSGAQAKAAKLVDELGTLQDAANEAAKQAKVQGKPHLVYPEKGTRGRLWDMFFDDGSNRDEESASRLGGGMGGVVQTFARALLGEAGSEAARDVLPEPGIYWLWKGARW